MVNENLTIIELTEENIESLIYEIRGQKVMLDFDLARIYGYSTRDFNNQIKHNIERFDKDFRFQLTKDEWELILKWKKTTSSWGGIRKLPFAFTEQGIYMLMTVLRGELAIKQSKAIIRLFKNMKDYIANSNNLTTVNELLKLTNQVNSNTKSIQRLEQDNSAIKGKLEIVMNNFLDPSTYKRFLILNGEKTEAEIAYKTIYSLAKQSIYIVDDYINIKTLHMLLSAKEGVAIIIASDNVAKDKLQPEQLEEFINESGFNAILKRSNGLCHDRWIIIDYKTPSEQLFISGASSKDAGNKITTIFKEEHSELYHQLIDKIFFSK